MPIRDAHPGDVAVIRAGVVVKYGIVEAAPILCRHVVGLDGRPSIGCAAAMAGSEQWLPSTSFKGAVMDVIENEKRPGGTLDSRSTG